LIQICPRMGFRSFFRRSPNNPTVIPKSNLPLTRTTLLLLPSFILPFLLVSIVFTEGKHFVGRLDLIDSCFMHSFPDFFWYCWLCWTSARKCYTCSTALESDQFDCLYNVGNVTESWNNISVVYCRNYCTIRRQEYADFPGVFLPKSETLFPVVAFGFVLIISNNQSIL